MAICDCTFWGENRSDCGFMDVGCVLGKCLCDETKCKQYQKVIGVPRKGGM